MHPSGQDEASEFNRVTSGSAMNVFPMMVVQSRLPNFFFKRHDALTTGLRWQLGLKCRDGDSHEFNDSLEI